MTNDDERAQLERIKSALADPAHVLELLGLKSKREGSAVKFLCPWHSERSPSCSAQNKNGTLLAHCFGCGQGGDIFSLVAAVRGVDFPEAKRIAADLAGVTLERGRGTFSPSSQPSRPAAPKPKPLPGLDAPAADATLFHEVATVLARLPGARLAGDVAAYLGARGLLELARADGWFGLPDRETQPVWTKLVRDVFGDEHSPEALDALGLLQGATFRQPDNRLAIPWRDLDGTAQCLQRRRLDDGAPKYVFPAGRKPRVPYGADLLAASDDDAPVLFVEGAVDVLALRALLARDGLPGVVLGLPGVSGWNAAWSRFARGRVGVLALDADTAGERYAEKMTADLYAGGASLVKRLTPKSGKDWADMLREQRSEVAS